MALSQYLAEELLNWYRNSAFPAQISTVYVSVHTADPGNSGTQNDVTTTVAAGRATWGSAANSSAPASDPAGGYSISNTATVLLTNNAPAGATLTHFGIWDAVSGGNFLGSGVLTQSAAVIAGDTVQFNSGALELRYV